MKLHNRQNFNICQIRFPIWKYISNYKIERKNPEVINNTPRFKNMSILNNISTHATSIISAKDEEAKENPVPNV